MRWDYYEKCLDGILVTHSPRYQVNMELGEGEDIFSRMKTSYDAMRKGDPIAEFKKYYRAKYKPELGQQLWWMDNEVGIRPLARTLESMDYDEQENIVADCMVRFPEVFIPRGDKGFMLKYERPALHLMVEYQVVSHSLRDKFSASGQCCDPTGGPTKIPRVLQRCYDLAPRIQNMLSTIPTTTLVESWLEYLDDGLSKEQALEDPESTWEALVDRLSKWSSEGRTTSTIYRAGLDHKKR